MTETDDERAASSFSTGICERIASKRYCIGYMACISTMLHMVGRVVAPLAVVRMSAEPNTDPYWNNTSTIHGNGSAVIHQNAEFNWSRVVQALVIVSFFVEGIAVNSFYGWATVVCGGRKVATLGLLISGILTTVFPFGARLHFGLAILMGFLISTFSTSVLISNVALLSAWMPVEDRSTAMGLFATGKPLGIVIISSISGALMTIKLNNGWPWPFYIFGAVTIIWSMIWWVGVSDTPEDCERISERELKLILRSRPQTDKKPKKKIVPWRKILTSLPVWTYLLSQVFKQCVVVQIVGMVPVYFKDNHQMNSLKIGFYVAILSVPRVICPIASGILSDYIVHKKIFSLTTNRKIFCSVGHFVLVGMFIILAYIQRGNSSGALVTLCVITAFYSLGYISVTLAPLDLSTHFSGVISGIGRDLGQIISVILTIGLFLLIQDGTLAQWQIVWWITAGCNFLGGLVFLLFASAERQPWDNLECADETTPIVADTEPSSKKTLD